MLKLSRYLFFFFFIISILLVEQNVLYAAEPVGKIGYVRGVVSAKSNSGGKRLLSKDAEIYETDSIVTGSRSFVVLVFKDDTKVTVRPNSVFIIKQYRFANGNNDKATFRLLTGGIRAVTGSINKNKAEKMRITTPVASLGVRGTDFIARLCDGDCLDQGKDNKKTNTQAVARLALVGRKGSVSIKNEQGRVRSASTGDHLKVTDSVVTDEKGFAVLVFKDKTRVTVQPATELAIAQYVLPKGRPKQGKVLLDLVKGGVRTLTGSIAKANPREFKVKTPVAIMGIRGTGFDTYYDGQTYVTVWQGAVTANQGGSTQNIDLNQTFQMGGGKFNQLPQLPTNLMMQFNNTPRPDKVKTQTIWVSVKSGKVRLTRNKANYSTNSGSINGGSMARQLDNKDDSPKTGAKSSDKNTKGNTEKDGKETIELSSGETGVANEMESSKVNEAPPFIENDPYTAVAPTNVEAASDVFGNPDGDNKSCTVK